VTDVTALAVLINFRRLFWMALTRTSFDFFSALARSNNNGSSRLTNIPDSIESERRTVAFSSLLMLLVILAKPHDKATRSNQNYLPGDNIAAERTRMGLRAFAESSSGKRRREESQALVDESPAQSQEELAEQLSRLSPAIAREDRRARGRSRCGSRCNATRNTKDG